MMGKKISENAIIGSCIGVLAGLVIIGLVKLSLIPYVIIIGLTYILGIIIGGIRK